MKAPRVPPSPSPAYSHGQSRWSVPPLEETRDPGVVVGISEEADQTAAAAVAVPRSFVAWERNAAG